MIADGKKQRALLLVLLLLLCQVAEAKTSICLNMIVKNERHVIERVYRSVLPIIDYWVIVDTGSTDGTQEYIRENFTEVPGALYEREWKDFAHNRNQALELAKGKGDYILFMDADDFLEFDPDFSLPELTAGCYKILFASKQGGFSYRKPQLVRADLPWQWYSVYHEYISCSVPHTTADLDQVRYIVGGDGARSSDPEKYAKAAKVLKEALVEEPHNERYVFYLAESLRDAGEKCEAIDYYLQRSKMGGWGEEVFWSLFEVANLKGQLGYSYDEILTSYMHAHRARPHRAEPIYFLAERYNQNHDFALAYACIKGFQALPKPEQHDTLFTLNWIEDYGLDFQLSIAAFYLGQREEFVALCLRLLNNTNIPEMWRERVEKNLAFVPAASRRAESRIENSALVEDEHRQCEQKLR